MLDPARAAAGGSGDAQAMNEETLNEWLQDMLTQASGEEDGGG